MSSPAISLGRSLRATVEAIRRLVVSIHNGELPADVPSARSLWTPSFVLGENPTLAESKPFSAAHISQLLGNDRDGRAHEIVKIALLLLELQELGVVEAEDLEQAFKVEDLPRSFLHKALVKTKATLVEDLRVNEASEIMSASAASTS